MGARGGSHQFALRPMTGVEDREILLLLTHIRHAEVLTHRVRKQLRVVPLLRALDIHHVRVDLRLRRCRGGEALNSPSVLNDEQLVRMAQQVHNEREVRH